MRAGAVGVTMITTVVAAEDIADAARHLRLELEKWKR